MRRLAVAAAALAFAGCSSDQDTRVFRVPSASMEPTLHCARPGFGCEAKEMDLVAVRPYGDDDPERGDIVAFRTPPAAQQQCGAGGIFIKRVVGLPGERWDEKNGFIFVDGRKLSEPYLEPRRREGLGRPGGVIGGDEYLLLGDNRAQSCDSRVWGPAKGSSIIGRVVEIKRGSKRIHIR